MPFVLHESPTFAVAHVTFVLDAMFGTDIVRAHFEGVVDRVDHKRLEVVVALGQQLASFQERFPRVGRHLEHFQVIEPWLAFEEHGLRELRGERTLAELGNAIE